METTVCCRVFSALAIGSPFVNGVRLKNDGCLSSRKSGMEACITALTGTILEGRLDTITIQEVFWIVSIAWIFIQIGIMLNNPKNK